MSTILLQVFLLFDRINFAVCFLYGSSYSAKTTGATMNDCRGIVKSGVHFLVRKVIFYDLIFRENFKKIRKN